MRNTLIALAALVCCALAPNHAWAQAAGTASGGAIQGKVTDSTGAVLPGVAVTLASPALLGSAEAVTSDQGLYRFPSLPPGEYTLKFALPGFATLVRSGIHLTLAFTATVDAQLTVSTVQETVQVTGASPVVDAVNSRLQTSFNKEVLAAVPSARDMWAILSQSPAVQMARVDVGGSTAGTQTGYTAYGLSGQVKPVVEGIIGLEGSTSVGFYYDYGSFEEVNVGAAGQGAEMANPGVQSVFISKSGGNEFHGDTYGDFESEGLETTNIDDAQAAFGIARGSNRIHRITDLNAGAGGFIKKEKIWWYGSYRRQQIEVRQPNFPVRPFVTEINDFTGKLTYQLPKNNKLIAYTMYGIKKQPYRQLSFAVSSANAIYGSEQSTWNQYNPGYVWKVEWNGSYGGNLFAEARVGRWVDDWRQSRYTDEPRREDLVTLAVSGGSRNWNAFQDRPQTTGAISYYRDDWAGSHTIKFGWEVQKDDRREVWKDAFPGNIVNVFSSGAPAEVYLMLAPLNSDNRLYWNGLYLTDTWNLGRVTVNAGLRYDHYRSAFPDQDRPANEFAPALHVTGNDNIVTWNVLAPRLGIAWQVTPDARNVVKASVGRYYWNPSRTVPETVNPNTSPQWFRYRWTDLNGDRAWQRGEEGALLATRGAAARGSIDAGLADAYSDEVTTWFERQLAENFGVRTGIVYRRSTRLFQTVNVLNPPEAFSIATTVVDPATGGTLDLRNLQPALVGQTSLVVRNTPNYSEHALTWEIAANRRFSRLWTLSASYAVSWRDNYNAIPYTPNDPAQSDMLPMSLAKVSGSIEPGWGLKLTPVVRFQQGDPWARIVSARLNYGTQSVLAEPFGARRRDNVTIVDLRTERRFQLSKGWSASLFVDGYNLLNSNAATSIITTTGTSFLRPSTIVAPRVAKIGAKLSW